MNLEYYGRLQKCYCWQMSTHFQVLSLHYKGDVGEFESRHIFVSLIIIEMMCQTVYLFPFLVSVVRVGCNSLCSIHRFLDSTEVHGISIENKGRERRESSLVGVGIWLYYWVLAFQILMTPWYGNIFHTTGPLCRETPLVAGGFQWKVLIEYVY